MKKSKSKVLRPIDIPLIHGIPYPNGAIAVVLPTLEDLESFWLTHRAALPFAVGNLVERTGDYLAKSEWVFGPTKASVVEIFTRWEALGVSTTYSPFNDDGIRYANSFFWSRDEDRNERISQGRWSSDEESAYKADCILRSRETYRGFWRLTVPGDVIPFKALLIHAQEIFDPGLSVQSAAQTFQVELFNAFRETDELDAVCYDRLDLNKLLKSEREEKDKGHDFYGDGG